MRLYRYLIHTCTIERLTLVRGDSGEDVETWQEAGSFRCRLLEGPQALAGAEIGAVVRFDHRLALDPGDIGDSESGTSILLTDRVKYVTLETKQVTTGPFRIEEIVTKRRKKAEAVIVGLVKVTTEREAGS